MIVEAMSVAAAGLDLASSVLALPESKKQTSAAQIDSVIGALRAIYFVPQGTISLLDNIAEGRTIDVDEARSLFEDFDGRDKQVYDATDKLDYNQLMDMGHFSIRASRELEMLKWNKVSLRNEVRQFLRPVVNGQTPDRGEASRLRTMLEALNEKIEQLEEAQQMRRVS